MLSAHGHEQRTRNHHQQRENVSKKRKTSEFVRICDLSGKTGGKRTIKMQHILSWGCTSEQKGASYLSYPVPVVMDAILVLVSGSCLDSRSHRLRRISSGYLLEYLARGFLFLEMSTQWYFECICEIAARSKILLLRLLMIEGMRRVEKGRGEPILELRFQPLVDGRIAFAPDIRVSDLLA